MPEVNKKPWSEYPPELHPKQRIFLSIDIAGSTELKTSLAVEGKRLWVDYFTTFLSDTVFQYRQNLRNRIESICIDKCVKSCIDNDKMYHNNVNVWKYSGDEVILVSELYCLQHASLHVLALADTIAHFNGTLREFNKKLSRAKKTKPLSHFKGTAWVASFPVNNSEINLTIISKNKSVPIKDYMGQSMDIGFRLSKYATKDRLVVCANLAHIIVNSRALFKGYKYRNKTTKNLQLCTGGFVETKGAMNNEHPLLWYSIDEKADDYELCKCGDREALISTLDKYLTSNKFIIPFMPDEEDTDYYEKYNQAVDEQKNSPESPFFEHFNKSAPTPSEQTSTETGEYQEILKSNFSNKTK